ncbi:MAG: SPOR domain-containing protein, partial [Deltaproteobacteria bacterium]|nr:SPOR domain-containing protein [Deltaproteobacteria bacterium]
KKEDDKASSEESPVPKEEDAGVEIFFDSGDSREETSSDIERTARADEEITEVLEKSALNTMISALEGGGRKGDEKASAEESSASEEEEADVGIVVDGDDLKEEISADTEGIDEATKEGPLFQEKPAAPSSIIIEDSLFETNANETYPESTFEEESIPEDRKEVVEEAPQAVDLEKEQTSDSANADLKEEKTRSQEKPAAFTAILSKLPGNEVDVFDVHHILEDKERPTLEEKREGIERTSEAVGLEIGPLSDSSEPAKEEPRFQDILMPSLMSSKDSKVNTDAEEHHHKPVAEEESVPKEEDGIERVSESVIPGKEEPADLEEDSALTEEDLQLIRRSGHHSKVIRIGLPLVLFGILVIILIIQYSPLDFFSHEQARKLMSDQSVEVSSPKKQGVTPKTLRERSPATKQGIQPSTPASAEKEIVRAPVPRKRDAGPKTQKETVDADIQEVQPSTAEPPIILAMKENVEGSSPRDQNTTSTTSKETFVTTDLEVQPQPPEPATPPPPGDAFVKAEANQSNASISRPYSVYLGSYSTLKSTEKAISNYNENGLSSLYWQEVDLGDKGIWYRVFTGQFETKNEAEEYVKERQLVDAEVRKTEPSAIVSSVSVKDIAPKTKIPEKQRLLPEAMAGSSYPYSVYAGSYKDLDRARKAVSDLQKKGASYWVRTDLGEKGIWYRVYIGCFQTRDQAETFIKNHQIADGESKRTTYANLIGTYGSEEELDRMRLSLLNLEFSPYVIEASGGKSHLFTGAFYQKADAEKEQLDLKAKGIKSQLVER